MLLFIYYMTAYSTPNYLLLYYALGLYLFLSFFFFFMLDMSTVS